MGQVVTEHFHYFSKFLPLVCASLVGVLLLPALGGIYLHRAIRSRFRGWFWSSRAASVLIPICTVLVTNTFLPELFVILPGVAGLFAGWALRRRVQGRAWPISVAIPLVVGIAAAAVGALLLRLARIGVWDALVMLLAAGLGYLGGCATERRDFSWKKVALVAASMSAALVIAEILTRLAFPVLPKYYSEHATGIRFPRFDLVRLTGTPQTPWDLPLDFTLCAELFEDNDRYPLSFPQFFEEPQSLPKRAVLHLGDSLTQGHVDNEGSPFPDFLQEATPEVRQINLGQGGTEPDFYYLIARKWVPHLPIELVIVHVFLGNDIWELGKPYRCCADGPLLRRTAEGIEQICLTPRWQNGFGESLAWFAAASPPPSLVRHFTPDSQFARYLVATILGLQRRYLGAPTSMTSDLFQFSDLRGEALTQVQESPWLMFEAIMRGLRDDMAQDHVPLVVSLLPANQDLHNDAPQTTYSYQARMRALDILKQLEIEVLDPWDALESLVKKVGPDAVFLPHGDAHFNATGHRFYAEWLLQQLGPRIGAVTSAG